MIFDNCLNNPADGWRQTATEDKARGTQGQGFQEPPNSLYMYSSVTGRIAPDGPPGQNSPFGAAFLRVLDGSDVDLRTLTGRVNREVIIASAGRQICSFRNAYAEPYVLRTSPPAQFPPPANPLAADASRVVELPNAIAFAREKKLPMTTSLIGIRPPAGMPHANKVGAYRYDLEGQPNILIIFNVEDPKSAEVQMVYYLNGTYSWTWVRGSLVNDKLEVRPRSAGGNHVFSRKSLGLSSGRLDSHARRPGTLHAIGRIAAVQKRSRRSSNLSMASTRFLRGVGQPTDRDGRWRQPRRGRRNARQAVG
jgi:hypothetical protein